MEIKSHNKSYNNVGNVFVLGLIDKPGTIILDIGCGEGSIAKILSAKGHTVDAITISAEELEHARPYTRDIFLHNLEEGLPGRLGDSVYDYVICSHVLEHIAYPNRLLSDIKRVLKPDGELIVALPNVMYYKFRWELLKGNFRSAEMGIWDYTHVRWYTFASAKELLIKNSFDISMATATGRLPFHSILSRVLPETMRQKIHKLLIGISKGFFGYQLLFKATVRK